MEKMLSFQPGRVSPDSFQCLRCGKCCRWKGLVKITPEEADAIIGFLGIPADEFFDRMTRISPDRSALSLTEKEDGSCFFYDAESRLCRIQSVKPAQCRAFPFTWNFPGWEDVCEGGRRLKARQGS